MIVAVNGNRILLLPGGQQSCFLTGKLLPRSYSCIYRYRIYCDALDQAMDRIHIVHESIECLLGGE